MNITITRSKTKLNNGAQWHKRYAKKLIANRRIGEMGRSGNEAVWKAEQLG